MVDFPRLQQWNALLPESAKRVNTILTFWPRTSGHGRDAHATRVHDAVVRSRVRTDRIITCHRSRQFCSANIATVSAAVWDEASVSPQTWAWASVWALE